LIRALNSSSAKDANNITSVKREDLKVMVLNGTKIDGLAGTARDTLLSLGYSNVSVGNYGSVEKSVIQTNNKDLKQTISNDINIEKLGKIVDSEYKDYDAVIILGTDYNLFGQ
uniref:LytR C-terminal domain-containing protein n=1 Tax=Clostridium sp. TaxID=1506 RepID=UPI00262E528C